jgi:aconitate hydratase
LAHGLEVALAIAGEPFFMRMPRIWGIRLTGRLQKWVSAKDVILEMLRRHGVAGGVGRIIESYGPGLEGLSAMDRHVIANMGAELGATSTVFPADREVRRFLRAWKREDGWVELVAGSGAKYDEHDEIDLAQVEPLIAMPSSPGNVRPVREVAGEPIQQAYIGSSANPGYRDFAIAARMTRDRTIDDRVSFDVNPTSRAQLEKLVRDGHILDLLHAGARLHQAGCNGCIGMGQAPATKGLSLRTVPRNFPGRSGTREDKVCLVSPETATASALCGVITDPRTLDMPYPEIADPDDPPVNREMFMRPLPAEEGSKVALDKGPNIATLPSFEALEATLELPVLLKVGDDISTDEIMPAGARVLPFRSNIPKIAEFAFDVIDSSYAERARQTQGHAVVGGGNYGQGSSREHAALGPRFLGLRVVLAKSFARIHAQNLVNFGVLALSFVDAADYERIEAGDTIRLVDLRNALVAGPELTVENATRGHAFKVSHAMSERQVQYVLRGGLIKWMKERLAGSGASDASTSGSNVAAT